MKRTVNYIFILLLIVGIYIPAAVHAAGRLIHTTSVYKDNKEGPIILPEGVGCNDQSVFIVADSGNGRLVKYTLSGDTIQDGSTIKVPEVSHPTNIEIASSGDILVLDGTTHRIARVGANGDPMGVVEPAGLKAPSNMVPRSFTIGKDGSIYILDVFGERVIVTDGSGKILQQMPFPADYGFMSDIVVGPLGGVFLLDSVDAKLYAWEEQNRKFEALTGEMREYMDFPTNFVVDAKGNFYIVDHNAGGVVTLGRDGSYQGRQLSRGWNEGLLLYPTQICVNGKGEVFIADRNNSRVQVFSLIQ